MSTSQPFTLPQLGGDPVGALSHDQDIFRNTNQGSGTQHNATQAYGHGNSQYNANEQHFYGHDHPRFERKSFLG
jgi:hypothetical protein